MSTPYQKALESGYSPEEVKAFLIKKYPQAQKALDAGYSPEEISNFISQRKSPQESLGSNIGRQTARTGSRVAETILGAPRAFGEFLEGVVPEKLLTKGAEKIGLKEPVEKGLELAKKYAPYKLFPKSEDIRQFNKFLFGEKLEPKTQAEEKADSLVSDFTALALPFPGSKFKLLKPGLLALGGNIASEIVGKIGGSEKEKTYAKLGTFLVGSMINPKSAINLEKDLYKQARESRPGDATVNASKLEKSSNSFLKALEKGDPNASSKKKTVSLLNDIKNKIKNNKIEVEELEQFKRDINEARSSLYDEFKMDKVGRRSAKRNLDMASGIIDKTLFDYGKTNPTWESYYRPANEVHGAIAQSKKARNFLDKVIKKYGLHLGLSALGIGHFAGAASTLTAGALGTGALFGGEIAAKIMKSPTLRKHYINVINSALKQDVVATKENLDKLENILKRDQSKAQLIKQ